MLQEMPHSKVQEPPVGISQYVVRLKKHWEMVKQHVKESARLYQLRMRQRHRNKNNTLRKFEVGDEVTYFKPDPLKRLAKITQKQQLILHSWLTPSVKEYKCKSKLTHRI